MSDTGEAFLTLSILSNYDLFTMSQLSKYIADAGHA